MRIYSLLIMVACLTLALYAGAVEFDPATPIQLSVRGTGGVVPPGQTVRISLSATDQDYQLSATGTIVRKIDDPVTLSYEATGGQIQRFSNSRNPAELSWISPTTPGNYVILISADDSGKYADDPMVKQMLEFIVQPQNGGVTPPSVRVAVNPQTIQLAKGTSATVTAQLIGKDVKGRSVRFFSTRGSLSATQAVTDANGTAAVQLTVGTADVGTASVAAIYGNTTATTTVQIVPRPGERQPVPDVPGPPVPPGTNPPGFLVDVNPRTLPADGGSSAVVTVRLTDLRGNGIPRQTVIFRVTMGRIAPVVTVTDPLGYARTELLAPDAPGWGMVIAETGAQRGYAVVQYTGEQPTPNAVDTAPRIFLTVDPTVLTADGTSKSRIEALVLDGQDRAMVNTTVTFDATLGALQNKTVATGADGKATTTLTAPDRPGTGTVTAIVGQTNAASQITFQAAPQAGPGLDIRYWNGQKNIFVSENWLHRMFQVENGQQGNFDQTLTIMDANAKVAREYPLGRNGVIITDQYGIARGYGIEENGREVFNLLQPDGTPQRAVTVPLPLGSHIALAQYASPAGTLLVALANPDGTKPEVQYIGPDGAPILVLRDGLEAMPVMGLGGDGYLVVALPGGTVRLYTAKGVLISEGRRSEKLPAVKAAVGPGGEWYAVASGNAEGTGLQPTISVFTRQGTLSGQYEYAANALTPAGSTALAVSTPDRTVFLNLATRQVTWTYPSGYERFLATEKYGMLAGQRDPEKGTLVSRITLVRLSDGQAVASQAFGDFQSLSAVLPPDDKGRVGVITAGYTFRFPIPEEK